MAASQERIEGRQRMQAEGGAKHRAVAAAPSWSVHAARRWLAVSRRAETVELRQAGSSPATADKFRWHMRAVDGKKCSIV